MYLVANVNVEICASKSCKLCTQYCPEANTIQYSEEMGKEQGFKYGSAYIAVDRCKGCAKNNAIKMTMIDQLPKAALTDNITYGDKSTTAVLASPMVG
jgi:Pyruvate/2-oxoacid:ferredoxin oxidoreductase delta subunit